MFCLLCFDTFILHVIICCTCLWYEFAGIILHLKTPFVNRFFQDFRLFFAEFSHKEAEERVFLDLCGYFGRLQCWNIWTWRLKGHRPMQKIKFWAESDNLKSVWFSKKHYNKIIIIGQLRFPKIFRYLPRFKYLFIVLRRF